ncbi:unnamed protein product [Amoebophrya sp. A25]|nr:unnamed protein product [Amoebophrya sp. A25]|eukprot:GSA25T00024803001.1
MAMNAGETSAKVVHPYRLTFKAGGLVSNGAKTAGTYLVGPGSGLMAFGKLQMHGVFCTAPHPTTGKPIKISLSGDLITRGFAAVFIPGQPKSVYDLLSQLVTAVSTKEYVTSATIHKGEDTFVLKLVRSMGENKTQIHTDLFTLPEVLPRDFLEKYESEKLGAAAYQPPQAPMQHLMDLPIYDPSALSSSKLSPQADAAGSSSDTNIDAEALKEQEQTNFAINESLKANTTMKTVSTGKAMKAQGVGKKPAPMKKMAKVTNAMKKNKKQSKKAAKTAKAPKKANKKMMAMKKK